MGFTSEALRRSLEAVGCRVVESVEGHHVFARGAIKQKPEILTKAFKAGEKLARTLHLHNQVKDSMKM